MVRVIFPNGTEVKYENSDNWNHYVDLAGNRFIKIFSKTGGWVASVPCECIVDFGQGNLSKTRQLELAVDLILENAKIMRKWQLTRLKRLLNKYKPRTDKWI